MAEVERMVRTLAVTLTHAAGVELVDVQFKGSGSRQLLRVIVDRKGGVALDECQRLSQQLSARLDESDPIPGGYALEVTSPGIDWPLTTQRDFDRIEGRDVLVHRENADGELEQLRGMVETAEEDAVVLAVEPARKGQHADSVRIPYADIKKARQSLPW